MSDISLFGGHTTASGQRLSGGLARQAKRQQHEIELRTERFAVEEQARAFLASQAMSNVSVLVLQARAHIAVDPGGADIYEGLIRGHAAGSASRLSRF
ncbi:hypothetical protein [Microbacterium enclense]|uniref:hypothetical protein n=1 Tax=Microbacterium enclense TaxID=993073 RepID=UPI00342BD6A0